MCRMISIRAWWRRLHTCYSQSCFVIRKHRNGKNRLASILLLHCCCWCWCCLCRCRSFSDSPIRLIFSFLDNFVAIFFHFSFEDQPGLFRENEMKWTNECMENKQANEKKENKNRLPKLFSSMHQIISCIYLFSHLFLISLKTNF